MSLIHFRGADLYMEDVPVAEIAAAAGTPTYAYSRGMIERRYGEYQAGFGPLAARVLTCFAVKANSNQAVLRVLRNAGAGADLTTGGELERAIAAGFDPKKIVFSGIGKRSTDLARALEVGIRQINVESTAEMERINTLAEKRGVKAPIAFRLNPQLDSLARPEQAQITTGKADSKFGIPWPVVEELLPHLKERFPHLDVVGISVHIGSNFQPSEFGQLEALFATVREVYLPSLTKHGVNLRSLDIGGGVGVNDEDPFQADNPLIKRYGALVQEHFTALLESDPNITLVIEPGRSLVAESGLVLTRIINVKEDMAQKPETGLAPRFVVVDAAMNDFMRPGLYSAFHLILPVRKSAVPTDKWWSQVDICGTVCETTDSFMRSVATSLGEPLDREDVDPEALRQELANLPQLKTKTDYPEEPPAFMLGEADPKSNRARAHLASFIRRRFPPVAGGDLLALAMAGAYGAGLGSEFNSRPMAPEVLVDGDRFAIIRMRRQIEDIISGEAIPSWVDG